MFTFYPAHQFHSIMTSLIPDSSVVLEKNTRWMRFVSVQDSSLLYKPFNCNSARLKDTNNNQFWNHASILFTRWVFFSVCYVKDDNKTS